VIAPRNRALLAFGLTVLPATLTAAFTQSGWLVPAALFVLFCCVAAVDAVEAMGRLKCISVTFPERVNLTRNREGTLEFLIEQTRAGTLSVLVGLGLPPAVIPLRDSIEILVPAGAKAVTATWQLTARERGIHQLDKCYLCTSSFLGLWAGRSSVPVETRIHVYPGIFRERKSLAALLLRRNDIQVRPQRQVGQGREFEKLRPYLAGDGLGDIHWKASAKRGHLVTKEFQIERTQEIYVIIDTSRLSARTTDGPEGDSLLEGYLSAALMLAVISQRQGDLFGVMTFSDRPHAFVRAKSGTSHFAACREALSTTHWSLVTPNYDEMASFLAARLRRRALLLFLTSLDEPVLAENFARCIRILRQRHLVLVNVVKPEVARPLFSDDGVSTANELYERLGGHFVWHGLRQAQESLRLRGVDLALVDNKKLCATMISRYLNVKRRQML
jgi:uncharacterized protein (DUF58 family)